MCIHVIVANEHAFVRNGLRCLLDAQPGISVVGDAVNASAAIHLVTTLKPEIAIIDLALVPQNGIKVTEEIIHVWADAKVIIFSLRRSAEYVDHCFKAGAKGYVLAESLGSEIVDAVRVVNKGRFYLSAKLSHENTVVN